MKPEDPRPVRVADIVRLMEKIAPPYLAESWDNCGLQVGDLQWPAEKVWVALDPLSAVVDAAGEQGVDMVITHHPLIFKPLRTIDLERAEGRVIAAALRNRIALFAAHTNLDSVRDGINDELTRKIGLDRTVPLVPADISPTVLDDMGIGRVGRIKSPVTVLTLARKIKKQLGLSTVKVAGRTDIMVGKVAVCSGSGGSLLDNFLSCGAEVFVTGDTRYHDARIVEDAGRALIDIGHFASEHIMIDMLCRLLSREVAEAGWDVRIEACDMEQDPFELI